MANPQPDKFTKISNELMENIPKVKLNGTQVRILLILIRYTYGFNRKDAELSLTFFSTATGIHKKQIKRELNLLIDKKVIKVIKEASFNSTRSLSLNKDYEQWEIEKSIQGANPIPGSELDPPTGSELDPPTGSELDPQERHPLKTILKKDVGLFFESIWLLYPKKEGKGQVSDTQKKKLYKIGYPLMKSYVEAYIKEKTGTEKRYLQNGSTFFNSGYIDYLESVADKPKEPVKLNIIYREFGE